MISEKSMRKSLTSKLCIMYDIKQFISIKIVYAAICCTLRSFMTTAAYVASMMAEARF